MQENNMKAIDDFIKELSKLDCGSNSCEFAQNKSGQRSNSGCQCLRGYRDRVKMPVFQLWRALNNKFTDAPISGYEALYDVEVPVNDVAKEQMLKAFEVFKNMIPKEYNALYSDAQKVADRFDEHYRKLNSEQKPLDADIAEHINNHFEELL